MAWYIFFTAVDNSHSLIHSGYVMNAGTGKVSITDKAKFFWKNKPVSGTVVHISESKDECREKLTSLGVSAKRVSKEAASSKLITIDNSEPSLTKRRSKPTQRYVAEASDPHPHSGEKRKIKDPIAEEDLKRKKILELNKQHAAMYANKKIMGSLRKTDDDKDEDFSVQDDEQSGICIEELDAISTDSTDTTLHSLGKKSWKRQQEGKELVNGIVSLKDKESVSSSNMTDRKVPGVEPLKVSSDSSPTKTALKAKLISCEEQLQMLYEEREKAMEESELLRKLLSSKQSISVSGKGEASHDPLLTEKDGKSSGEHDLGEGEPQKNDSDSKGQTSTNGSSASLFHSSDTTLNGTYEFPLDNSLTSQEELDKSVNGSSPRPEVDDLEYEDDEDGDYGDLEELAKKQLYGEAKDTTLLLNNTYCKSAVLNKTLREAASVVQVARRLIGGVFKLSSIKTATLTGQQWRAGGSKDAVDPLYPPAIRDIIAYAKGVAPTRKWKVPKADTPIRTSMTQRVGELKRGIKNKGESYVWKRMILN